MTVHRDRSVRDRSIDEHLITSAHRTNRSYITRSVRLARANERIITRRCRSDAVLVRNELRFALIRHDDASKLGNDNRGIREIRRHHRRNEDGGMLVR